ncbi:MAG: uridine phosphorylase [Candidatus Limnocylindrus sp.]|jgi:uridine phosphorylase
MALTEADGRKHHVGLKKGEVGRYALLPGDPDRVAVIARRFDNPKFVAQKREYTTWTGELDGVPVACTSTGIGCPSTAIAVEELVDLGVDTFIRVGTSGSMQHHIKPGSIGVITGAIRDEGTSRHYLPLEFPAVADLEVTLALREAAVASRFPWYLGVAQSKDSFYGQHNPERMPIAEDLARRWKAWMAGGAICSEMEAATLFIVASTLRVRAGGAMLILGNPEQRPMTDEEMANCSIDRVIDTSIDGLRRLIAADRAAGRI